MTERDRSALREAAWAFRDNDPKFGPIDVLDLPLVLGELGHRAAHALYTADELYGDNS